LKAVYHRAVVSWRRNEMEKHNPNTQNKPYEPPKAEFIPLKIEERLMSCTKEAGTSSCCSIAAKYLSVSES
jgi:hypothetical protein